MYLHFHNPFRRQPDDILLRNFLFGVEDSLVSTVGLLAGIATADLSHAAILTTGLLPLTPYLFVDGNLSIVTSVALSLLGLFTLGYITAQHYARPQLFRRALRMCALGGLAVIVGVLIGKIFQL